MYELSAYSGDYVDPGNGTVSVRLEGGELYIALAAFKGLHLPLLLRLVLYHSAEHAGEAGLDGHFGTGADGKVSEMTMAVGGFYHDDGREKQ